MNFFHTDKEPRYMVSIYRWSVSDAHYYRYYRDAKRFYDDQIKSEHDEGTVISLYDIQKDVRKEFYRASGGDDRRFQMSPQKRPL